MVGLGCEGLLLAVTDVEEVLVEKSLCTMSLEVIGAARDELSDAVLSKSEDVCAEGDEVSELMLVSEDACDSTTASLETVMTGTSEESSSGWDDSAEAIIVPDKTNVKSSASPFLYEKRNIKIRFLHLMGILLPLKL